MIAVFVNCATIIVGSIIGLLFSKKFTKELSEMIQTACGIITMILGYQMAFKYNSIVYLTLSLIFGAVIGYAIDIDKGIMKFGAFLEKLFFRKSKTLNGNSSDPSSDTLENQSANKKNFPYAFLNSSVLFCVGAMAIVGSFQAGVEHNYTTIFTKSIMDGFMALTLTTTMGIGVAFSSLMILLYQGSLTLLSTLIQPYVSDLLINEISACGGAIIVMIGLNVLGLKKIKTANFLPALVIQVLFVIFVPMIKNLITK